MIDLFAPPTDEEIQERRAARERKEFEALRKEEERLGYPILSLISYKRYKTDKDHYRFTFTYAEWLRVRSESVEIAQALLRKY